MGSLDSTILASALPTIGRDFGDVHNLPWLITAYLLSATAGMPLYGKIADIHGRRFTLRLALAIYIVASLICALAPSMLVLILGRALDRKSTRLNSSHLGISYAVFCLKKKKNKTNTSLPAKTNLPYTQYTI